MSLSYWASTSTLKRAHWAHNPGMLTKRERGMEKAEDITRLSITVIPRLPRVSKARTSRLCFSVPYLAVLSDKKGKPLAKGGRKTMSYVPPHLRSSSSTTVATRISSLTPDSNDHSKLAFSSNSHFNSSPTPSSPSTFSNPSRRISGAPSSSRTLSVPDAVFPHWQPSERVSRMKPEQVSLFHFLFFLCLIE